MKSRLLLSLLLIFLFKSILAQSAPMVVVSIKPIHSIVQSLMEDVASPELLLNSNNSAHTFHLKPSQIKMIENADLVVTIGDEFEIGLRRAFQNFDESKRLEISRMASLKTHKYRADKLYEKDPQDTNQDDLRNDMHLWLDIDNMKKISKHINSLLIDIDPDNENKYNENLSSLMSKLDALQIEIEKQMLPFSSDIYATYSDTIQYFEKKYNLGRPIIVTPYHGARLSINRTLASKNTINDLDVSCLFYGTDVRKSQISVLSEGLDVKAYKIDILGQEFDQGPDQYFKFMQNISNQVTLCLK
ncbi:ABC transporter substrate-binding protein [bacterium]|nr:ABC transporter substrate-binding protein [bacterium]